VFLFCSKLSTKKEIRVTRALAIASSGVSFGMAEEQLVLAYCDGTVFSFERARERSESVFGGPMRAEPSGIEHGPKPLHMIARLGSLHLPVLRRHHLLDMCYDGCRVEYRIDFGGKIELRELRPTQSSEDWPYPHFPPLLPYVPLQIGDTRRCTYAEFAQAFPNMPNAQPSELVVAVPPQTTLGVSLWDSGDDEGVTILFECDLADRVVAASNLCS
jgi:hypothetical protein